MNVRIFWVRAMECMCAQTRPRFILSSERVFGGMEFEPMLTPREKSPLPENVPRGGSNPRRCGQRAQALPTELLRPQEDIMTASVETYTLIPVIMMMMIVMMMMMTTMRTVTIMMTVTTVTTTAAAVAEVVVIVVVVRKMMMMMKMMMMIKAIMMMMIIMMATT